MVIYKFAGLIYNLLHINAQICFQFQEPMSRKKLKGGQKPNLKGTCIYEKGIHQDGQPYCIPYYLINELGRGGFARCYSVRVAEEKEEFAVKIFDKHSNRSHNIEKIENEIQIMSSLHHEGIVKFIHRFEGQDEVYMIMELCNKGSLDNVMKYRGHLSEPEVRYIIAQLIPVLVHIKASNVIHRDIKMGNIFFDENYKVKVGDFGLSTHLDNALMKKNICGTPNYIAPEIISREQFGCQVDVWSTGVLIYTLLLGRPPFEGKSVQSTYSHILKGQVNFQDKIITLSNSAISFLKRLIVIDRSQRMKLEQILQHPFMTVFDIPKQLDQKFNRNQPPYEFIQRYSKQKSIQPSLEQKSQDSHNNPLSFLSIDKKAYSQTTKTNTKRNQKIEINLLQTSSIYDSQEAVKVNELKRGHPSEDLKEYFGEVTKKFRKNTIQTVVTRGSTRKRLESQTLTAKFKEICRKSSVLELQTVIDLFQIHKEEGESTKLEGLSSFSRVVYFRRNSLDHTMTYLTNHYLMGIIFSDKSSIIYQIREKKTFYVQIQNGIINITELKYDIRPEQCDDKLKKSIILFINEHKIIKQLIKTNEQIKNSLTMSKIDKYLSFSFVQDVLEQKKMAIFQISNGDMTFFPNKDKSFVYLTKKQQILTFVNAEMKAIISISDLSCPEINTLIVGCDLILKMLSKREMQIVEREKASTNAKLERKSDLLNSIAPNRGIKANDPI